MHERPPPPLPPRLPPPLAARDGARATERPHPRTSGRARRLPVLLSAFVFPGAGQLVQRRRAVGMLFILAFGAATVVLAIGLAMLLLHRMPQAWQGLAASVAPADARRWAGWGGGVSLCLYLWSLLDTWWAERRIRSARPPRPPGAGRALALAFAAGFALQGASGDAPTLPPIHQAARAGDLVAIRTLLRADAHAHATRTDGGVTPLHLAAACDRVDVAALLHRAGADLQARTDNGFTPLHWAAARDAVRTAEYLAGSGVDIDAATLNGITPAHWAAVNNATNVLRMLLALGADTRAASRKGMRPLHWAVEQDAAEAALLLVAREVTLEEGEPEDTGIVPRAPRPRERVALTEALVAPLGGGVDIAFEWIESLRLWAARFETTNRQYRRVVPTHFSGTHGPLSLDGDEQPVVRVSWHDAVAYCDRVNAWLEGLLPEGYAFRLPTDREWMALARCGDGGRVYPWGNDLPPTAGNYGDRAAREVLPDAGGVEDYDDGHAGPCDVALSGRNAWGLHGMGGNVWEWCLDAHEPGAPYRSRRGGSWRMDAPPSLRIDHRGLDLETLRHDTIGFRIVAGPRDTATEPPDADARPEPPLTPP